MRILKCTCDFCGYSEDVNVTSPDVHQLPTSNAKFSELHDRMTVFILRDSTMDPNLEWCDQCRDTFIAYIRQKHKDIVAEATAMLKAGSNFDKELRDLLDEKT
jgi:hypothetical protein